MDLALEAGHTTLLTHDGLGVHVEVGHSWGDRTGETDKVHCEGAEGELRGHPLRSRVFLRQDSSLGDIAALPSALLTTGRHTPTRVDIIFKIPGKETL